MRRPLSADDCRPAYEAVLSFQSSAYLAFVFASADISALIMTLLSSRNCDGKLQELISIIYRKWHYCQAFGPFGACYLGYFLG